MSMDAFYTDLARREAAAELTRQMRQRGWRPRSSAMVSAIEALKEQAGGHLSAHVAGGDRDVYKNSLDVALAYAAAANLIGDRVARIANDRRIRTTQTKEPA